MDFSNHSDIVDAISNAASRPTVASKSLPDSSLSGPMHLSGEPYVSDYSSDDDDSSDSSSSDGSEGSVVGDKGIDSDSDDENDGSSIDSDVSSVASSPPSSPMTSMPRSGANMSPFGGPARSMVGLKKPRTPGGGGGGQIITMAQKTKTFEEKHRVRIDEMGNPVRESAAAAAATSLAKQGKKKKKVNRGRPLRDKRSPLLDKLKGKTAASARKDTMSHKCVHFVLLDADDCPSGIFNVTTARPGFCAVRVRVDENAKEIILRLQHKTGRGGGGRGKQKKNTATAATTLSAGASRSTMLSFDHVKFKKFMRTPSGESSELATGIVARLEDERKRILGGGKVDNLLPKGSESGESDRDRKNRRAYCALIHYAAAFILNGSVDEYKAMGKMWKTSGFVRKVLQVREQYDLNAALECVDADKFADIDPTSAINVHNEAAAPAVSDDMDRDRQSPNHQRHRRRVRGDGTSVAAAKKRGRNKSDSHGGDAGTKRQRTLTKAPVAPISTDGGGHRSTHMNGTAAVADADVGARHGDGRDATSPDSPVRAMSVAVELESGRVGDLVSSAAAAGQSAGSPMSVATTTTTTTVATLQDGGQNGHQRHGSNIASVVSAPSPSPMNGAATAAADGLDTTGGDGSGRGTGMREFLVGLIRAKRGVSEARASYMASVDAIVSNTSDEVINAVGAHFVRSLLGGDGTNVAESKYGAP